MATTASDCMIAARSQLEFDAFRIDRVQIRAGAFPVQDGSCLRIIATLGGGWDLRTLQGEKVHYDHGEICLLPPWLKRQASFRDCAENLLITVDKSLIERLGSEIGNAQPLETLAFQKLNDPLVYHLTHSLAAEVGPHGGRGKLYAESLVVALLGHVLRGGTPLTNHAISDAGLSPQKLRLCERYIDGHLADELTVEDVAGAVAMSPFHFTRAFKAATGKTPHRYVLERRIAAAESMVANTSRPLNEIAAEVGFCSPSHFSAVFQSFTGRTPSAHRRKHCAFESN
jgi:AraC family transcriptional regulator